MLTQINLSNTLSRNLPGAGVLSWLEIYFFIAMLFMLLNLCCHVSAMKAPGVGWVKLSDFIDDLGCGISSCLYFATPAILFLSKDCSSQWMPAEVAVIVIVLSL